MHGGCTRCCPVLFQHVAVWVAWGVIARPVVARCWGPSCRALDRKVGRAHGSALVVITGSDNVSVLAFVAVVARSKAFADTLQRTGCVCAFVRVLVCLMFAAFEGKALGPKARGWPSHEHFLNPRAWACEAFCVCACCHPFREWGAIAHRCVRVCGCAAAHYPFSGASGDGQVSLKACGWAAVPFSRKVDASVRGCGYQGRALGLWSAVGAAAAVAAWLALGALLRHGACARGRCDPRLCGVALSWAELKNQTLLSFVGFSTTFYSFREAEAYWSIACQSVIHTERGLSSRGVGSFSVLGYN